MNLSVKMLLISNTNKQTNPVELIKRCLTFKSWALKCLAQCHYHEKKKKKKTEDTVRLESRTLDYESNTAPLSQAGPIYDGKLTFIEWDIRTAYALL